METAVKAISKKVLKHEGKTICNAGIKEGIAIGQREENLTQLDVYAKWT